MSLARSTSSVKVDGIRAYRARCGLCWYVDRGGGTCLTWTDAREITIYVLNCRTSQRIATVGSRGCIARLRLYGNARTLAELPKSGRESESPRETAEGPSLGPHVAVFRREYFVPYDANPATESRTVSDCLSRAPPVTPGTLRSDRAGHGPRVRGGRGGKPPPRERASRGIAPPRKVPPSSTSVSPAAVADRVALHKGRELPIGLELEWLGDRAP